MIFVLSILGILFIYLITAAIWFRIILSFMKVTNVELLISGREKLQFEARNNLEIKINKDFDIRDPRILSYEDWNNASSYDRTEFVGVALCWPLAVPWCVVKFIAKKCLKFLFPKSKLFLPVDKPKWKVISEATDYRSLPPSTLV